MHPCALYVGLGVLQGRKRSVLCVCCCDCDRGAVLVVCVVVVVLWCARWSSLALIGVQKHRGVLVCRRGHRKHDNDPQSGGTGEGKYRQNKRQRKFLTSAGFPSVWCLSGVPEGLLIAGSQEIIRRAYKQEGSRTHLHLAADHDRGILQRKVWLLVAYMRLRVVAIVEVWIPVLCPDLDTPDGHYVPQCPRAPPFACASRKELERLSLL